METLQQKLSQEIETIMDFPKPGIAFKDLQSILANPGLMDDVHEALVSIAKEQKPDVIVGLESRGFIFGVGLARALGIPFVMARKPGKLPPPVHVIEYEKEYGTDRIEIREGVIPVGARVHIHDDLLATGGTAIAAANLVEQCGAEVIGMSFIMELDDLNGREVIGDEITIDSLVNF